MLSAIPGYFFNPTVAAESIPSDTGTCPACPTNCRPVKKNLTYFARAERQTENDIPVQVIVKRIVCTPTNAMPVPVCQIELEKLKNQISLR